MTTVGIRPFHLRSLGKHCRAGLALAAVIAPGLFAFPAATAAGPSVLCSFSAAANSVIPPVTNRDGLAPGSRLVLARDGNLYGTTKFGGSNGAGAFFRVSTTGSLTNLYSFQAATNDAGAINYDLGPNDLVQGTDGNFYGSTRGGGENFTGAIFAISPSGSFTNLHTFSAETTNSSNQATSVDGATPTGALVQGSDGSFYGTTQYGGANGAGTIFQITPSGSFTSLYSFAASPAGTVNTNGAVPNALIPGSDGAFYGTTQQGGLGNGGIFFRYTQAGVFTQIASLNAGLPGINPIAPTGPLAEGSNGVFYGISSFGGAQGGGCIFEITNTGGLAVLYSFPPANGGSAATVTLGSDGNIYGTTAANGLNGEGTLFRLTPQGDFGAFDFGDLNTNSDNAGGANPSAALTADSAGNFYGTCAAGGTNGSGVIFQFYGPNFIPPSFFPVTNFPPAQTNTLVGASVTFSYPAQGIAPLSYQWLLNGTNVLADAGDISGSKTGTLVIKPVFCRDVGSYSLVISNTWGALTSAVTVLTVSPPGVSITSPKPNASTNAPVFAGTATEAPLFAGVNPNEIRLTNVLYWFTNAGTGAVTNGVATLTSGSGGASNWTFVATPFPGTNILAVQSVDVSGNYSPIVSETFFYKKPMPLTVLTKGSGAGAFSLTNGSMLNLGQGYSITVTPISSVFSEWIVGGVDTNIGGVLKNTGGAISFQPTVYFVMQSNLVLTVELMARKPPGVVIASPKARERTNQFAFNGTAATSPLLPGANPTNIQLTQLTYWLTNTLTGSVITGVASLTNGGSISNWFIVVTNLTGSNTPAVRSGPAVFSPLLPGTNILALQATDLSGGLSPVVTQTFFYKVPSLFTLTNTGNGAGSFRAAVSLPGDATPTNGAMLNIGQTYTVTARPGPYSYFTNWHSSAGGESYSPANSFVMQSNLELVATFVDYPPVVTVSSPAQNDRTAAPVFNGTASGHFPITNVFCSLGNTNGVATLTPGTGSFYNWSIALPPSPGTNFLAVYCVDANSNRSATVARRFFYKVPARLGLTNAGTGGGTFTGTASVAGDTPPANGAMLNIGESYLVTAVPDKKSLFSNWVASTGGSSSSPALRFVMQSNLVLTATFATNFFPPFAGTYNGLFYPASGVSPDNSGMLYNLALGSNGSFSGKFLTVGTSYPFGSSFNASGAANFSVGPLTADLALDTATRQITGTVSESGATASLTADFASNGLHSQQYTMLLSPTAADSSNAPPGDGYALIANHNGMVTLSGALADGSRYNQTVPASQAGDVPVYAALYTQYTNTGRGMLLGWINLTNLQSGAPSNTLVWIKQQQPTGSPKLYTNGFSDTLFVTGSPWTNPAAISLANAQLVLSNTSLFLSYSNIGVSDNQLTDSSGVPTNSLTGAIDPKTGLLTLTFGSGKKQETYEVYGAILQDTTNAGGFFLTPTNAGSFQLQP